MHWLYNLSFAGDYVAISQVIDKMFECRPETVSNANLQVESVAFVTIFWNDLSRSFLILKYTLQIVEEPFIVQDYKMKPVV